jgi:hypothetical protein
MDVARSSVRHCQAIRVQRQASQICCHRGVKLQSVLQSDGSHQPRSHESTVMNTLYTKNTSIYEDFPLTHVEWHIRQQRWDSAI